MKKTAKEEAIYYPLIVFTQLAKSLILITQYTSSQLPIFADKDSRNCFIYNNLKLEDVIWNSCEAEVFLFIVPTGIMQMGERIKEIQVVHVNVMGRLSHHFTGFCKKKHASDLFPRANAFRVIM